MKTAIFIPVRTKSTRLSNKALLEIKGKPVIEHLIDRVKLAKLPQLIVLCTTTSPEDAILCQIARKNNISCFQGSEKDILDRYLQAALKYEVDFVVNADGDDIFCDPEYIDKVTELFVRTDADFISCQGLPFGAAPIGVKVEALKRACQLKEENDTETGWGRYFTDGDLFQVEYLKAEEEVSRPDIRMSLDYPEDYQFFKEVFERLYRPGKVFTLKEILNLLENNPDIVGINKEVANTYWEDFGKKASRVRWKSQAEKT